MIFMPTPRTQTVKSSPETAERVAKKIVELRKSRGLTQSQLASLTGISRTLLANYELGRTHLTDDTIIRLAQALKVSTDKLLGVDAKEDITALPSIRLVRRMREIATLPQADQKVILKTIDNFLKGANQDNKE